MRKTSLNAGSSFVETSTNTFKYGDIRLVVDRIEGEYAICEIICKSLADNFDTPMVDVRLSDIPFEVNEEDELIGHYAENNEVRITGKKPQKEIKGLGIPRKLIRFL